MIKNLLRLIVVLTCISNSDFSAAQEIKESYVVYNYNSEHGLPHDQILYAMQDSKGYMWFATGGGGVSRFDGTEFKTYDISDGLTDSDVFTIHEDFKGRLWFGTFNAQLSYLENDSIKNYKYNHVLKEKLTKKALIKRLHFAQDGTLTIIFSNHSLIRIDSSGNIDTDLVDASSLQVNILLNEKDQFTYLSSDYFYHKPRSANTRITLGHINNSENNSDEIHYWNIPSPHFLNPGNKRCHLVKNTEGPILLIGGQPYQLNNGINGDWTTLNTEKWLLDHCIINIFEKDGILWLLLENYGIVKGQFVDGTLQLSEHIFKNEFITYIHQDRNDGLWLCTIDKGVYYIPFPDGQSMSKNEDWAVFPKNLVVISDSAYAYADKPNTIVNQINHPKSIELNLVHSDYITDLTYHDSLNQLVILTKANLFIHDIKTGLTSKLIPEANQKSRILGGNNIVAKNRDNYHIAGRNILGLDITSKKIECIHECESRIWSLTSQGDKLLIGSNTGLNLLSVDQNNHISITFDNNHPIYHSYIKDFENYHGGTWIASMGNGIAFFKDSIQFTIGIEQGLSSARINGLKQDGDTLWAATDNGLNKITLNSNGKVKEILVFNTTSGLSSDKIMGIETSESYIFLSNPRSIDRIPRNILNSHSDETVISDLCLKSINSQKVAKWGDELIHSENDILITYETIDFQSVGKQQFRYRLDPLDSRWRYSDLRNIEYFGLIPEDYIFTIQKKTLSGKWGSEQKRSFSVIAPFWLRWWFITIVIACTIIATIWGIKTRERRLTTQLELKNQNIVLREKALRAQVNPHFLFNTLNSIQKYIFKEDFEASNIYLTKFSRLIREILEQSEFEYISLIEEKRMLTTYLELEKMRFNNEFNYQLAVDPSINIEQTLIPCMLIQPYIENAIIHGIDQNTENGFIRIRFGKDYSSPKSHLVCSVEDNGIGRSASMLKKKKSTIKQKSFGLTLSEKRLELIDNSDIPHVKIIDKLDENRNALGTKIELRIPIKIDSNESDS